MSMARIRTLYKVPVKWGQLVTHNGRRARIISARGLHFYARLEGSRRRIGPFHPRSSSLRYIGEDGGVLCNPDLCWECGERPPLFYSFCERCLPASYAALCGVRA